MILLPWVQSIFLSVSVGFFCLILQEAIFMEKNTQHKTWDSLPDTLTAKQISEFLGISRRRIYELFQVHVDHGGIPNYEIGASKRVEKEDFIQWIKQLKDKKQA
jgi:excisionase family DNA binding protein